MKTNQFNQSNKTSIVTQSQSLALLGALLLSIFAFATARAGDEDAKPDGKSGPKVEKAAEKPDPLPLHTIEGNGGVLTTEIAYLVNPPRNGEPVGRPSIGIGFIDVGQGRFLEAVTVTETPFSRLELGYGLDNFQLGDLPQAISNLTKGKVNTINAVQLHNFNARVALLKEGEFDQKWLPAITFGAHYKYNEGINQINNDLGGALRALGITNNQGVDFTLYASKLLTFLPRPVLVSVGGRATRAAHLGLLGFTSEYNFVPEANIVVFVTNKLALAAEYRGKPHNTYTAVPGLIESESDWWTIDAAYVVTKNLTVAAGYGHFGAVLNHDANGVWGVTTKWEF